MKPRGVILKNACCGEIRNKKDHCCSLFLAMMALAAEHFGQRRKRENCPL